MRLTLTLAVVLFAACAASAQAARPAATPAPTPTPAEGTKLERFQARTGAVIVKGYSDLGKLSGTGGTVEVTGMEFTDAQSGVKAQGVIIAVAGSGRYDRPVNSYIDYDEIDSLIKGIDYVSKIDKTVTRLDNFEAAYRTRGDFSITVFNDSGGKISVAVTSRRIGGESVYLKLEDLSTFRELILMAKGKLDSAK